MNDTFDFDDREDRRRFAADVLDRFASAGEPFPFDGENGRDAGRYGSTWGQHSSSELLPIGRTLLTAVAAVTLMLIVQWSIDISTGALLVFLGIAVVSPFLVHVTDVVIHRSHRDKAAESLDRAKVAEEELVILRELYENFRDDYKAGAQIAMRRASLRRIQRVPAYRKPER